jgi:hypothetical protein
MIRFISPARNAATAADPEGTYRALEELGCGGEAALVLVKEELHHE